MIKFYFIIVILLLLNNLIVVYAKVRQPFPGNGVLTITKNGGIEDTNEIVQVDLHSFQTLIVNRKLLPMDIKAIKDIYNDAIFKILPGHTNFTLQEPQFYEYLYYVSIPTPLLNYQQKTILWNSNSKKPSFFYELERIVFEYGVRIV
ncbi:hypothetical protein DICPUDRAFT_38991 [Dictyostelium purpureum]|uniref:Uncharacterized protein n=1 Tax=Dictyostelium purpureum TaxID=5786 RepID=F0ZVI5_DICPU|nr:uncharacterized protein DICPUDRAFT_38991 [Dictyostelium purpureum]EGC32048.1 hypothetical protein DICPUDRAFT_38991 [Dictyostelium purpureum]|eukprot:XP_003291434.1 hypothetical protein DICPUDRAFT_38991 [Dictyostelium purpureum]